MSKNRHPVMISVLNYVERLVGKFEEIIQLIIVQEDQSKIFNISHYIMFILSILKFILNLL